MTSRRLRGGLLALVVAYSAMTLVPSGAHGQATVIMQACKKLTLYPGAGGYYGDRLTVADCGTRFTAQDRYIALLVTVRRIDAYADVGIQLLDPSGSVLWAERSEVNPPAGTVYESYWIYGVLPIAAELREIAQEHLPLAAAAIRFPGRPARERPGNWILRVSLNRGRPQELRFSLEGPPPAPVSTSTPAPVTAPSPSPTTSP